MFGLADWLSHPFQSDQNAVHWFLFVGLIVISLLMWHIILTDLGVE